MCWNFIFLSILFIYLWMAALSLRSGNAWINSFLLKKLFFVGLKCLIILYLKVMLTNCCTSMLDKGMLLLWACHPAEHHLLNLYRFRNEVSSYSYSQHWQKKETMSHWFCKLALFQLFTWIKMDSRNFLSTSKVKPKYVGYEYCHLDSLSVRHCSPSQEQGWASNDKVLPDFQALKN